VIKLKYKELLKTYEEYFYNFFFNEKIPNDIFTNIPKIYRSYILEICNYNLTFSPYIQKKIYDFVFEKNLKYWYIERGKLSNESGGFSYLLDIYNRLYEFPPKMVEISNLEYAFLLKKILINKNFWQKYLINAKEFYFLFVLLNHDDILNLTFEENEKNLFVESLRYFFEKSLIINPTYFIYYLLIKKNKSKEYILRFFIEIVIKNNIPIKEANLEFLYMIYEYNSIQKINSLIDEYKNEKSETIDYKKYLDRIEKVYDTTLNPISNKIELLYRLHLLPKTKNEYFKEIIMEGVNQYEKG
jgi:hypothetical protein